MSDEIPTLIERLIQTGFWCAGDEGDPITEEKALSVLLERVESRLAKYVLLFVNPLNTEQGSYQVGLAWPRGKRILAEGPTLARALCGAALALPEFLREYPECRRR